MKFITPAASIAILASTHPSVGVACGFHFTKQHARLLVRVFPPRSISLPKKSTTASPTVVIRRRHRFSTPTTTFRRTISTPTTCFLAPESVLASPPPDKTLKTKDASSSIDDNQDEIEIIARNCLTITGSLPPPRDFGGISYLDTSSLSSNHAHRVVFILGGPGAGKGTQSERIVDTYKCVHLSVGELLRAGAERVDYPHADLVKECLVQGNIVPVELSLALLRIAMDEKTNDAATEYGSRIFLVDGFPRNFDNIQGWMEHMPSYTAVLGALVYNCPMNVLENRIMARAETSGRSDDNLESARRRFSTFQKQTEPVVRVLERIQAIQAEEDSKLGDGCSVLQVYNIDASGTVDDVWKATEVAMDAYVKNDVLTVNERLLTAIEIGDSQAIADICDESLTIDPTCDSKLSSTYDSKISNAKLEIVNGIHAIVSYDRAVNDDLVVRETREWKHGSNGWKCVSCIVQEINNQ